MNKILIIVIELMKLVQNIKKTSDQIPRGKEHMDCPAHCLWTITYQSFKIKFYNKKFIKQFKTDIEPFPAIARNVYELFFVDML